MAHSEDQVCQGPSTSMSDSEKMEGKQISLYFSLLFLDIYIIDCILHFRAHKCIIITCIHEYKLLI